MVIHRSAPFVVSTESGSRMRLLGEGWLLFVGGTSSKRATVPADKRTLSLEHFERGKTHLFRA